MVFSVCFGNWDARMELARQWRNSCVTDHLFDDEIYVPGCVGEHSYSSREPYLSRTVYRFPLRPTSMPGLRNHVITLIGMAGIRT